MAVALRQLGQCPRIGHSMRLCRLQSVADTQLWLHLLRGCVLPRTPCHFAPLSHHGAATFFMADLPRLIAVAWRDQPLHRQRRSRRRRQESILACMDQRQLGGLMGFSQILKRVRGMELSCACQHVSHRLRGRHSGLGVPICNLTGRHRGVNRRRWNVLRNSHDLWFPAEM